MYKAMKLSNFEKVNSLVAYRNGLKATIDDLRARKDSTTIVSISTNSGYSFAIETGIVSKFLQDEVNRIDQKLRNMDVDIDR